MEVLQISCEISLSACTSGQLGQEDNLAYGFVEVIVDHSHGSHRLEKCLNLGVWNEKCLFSLSFEKVLEKSLKNAKVI